MKRKAERYPRKLQRPRLKPQKTIEPEERREVRRQMRLTSRQHRRTSR